MPAEAATETDLRRRRITKPSSPAPPMNSGKAAGNGVSATIDTAPLVVNVAPESTCEYHPRSPGRKPSR